MRRSVRKSIVKRARKKRPKTFLEKRIEACLKQAGYEVKPEFPVGQCHVDFLVNGTLIIEAQGCYWHGCPRCNEKLSKRQKTRRLKDKKRFEFLLNAGYDLCLLWECDVNHYGDTWVLKTIGDKFYDP